MISKIEFANRIVDIYDNYECFKHSKKSRKRKSYLRKMFNAWYKCPDWQGEYNEEYWKMPIDFKCTSTVREFIWNNRKILTTNEIGCMLRLIEKHVKINSNKN